MNVYEGSLVATGLRFAVVVARFNSLVTEQLLSGALDALRRHGADEAAVDVYRCPGTFELPALLKRVALSGRYDAVVALGAVIRGGTPHFEWTRQRTGSSSFHSPFTSATCVCWSTSFSYATAVNSP